MQSARDLAGEMVARYRRQAVPLTASRVDIGQRRHVNPVPYERFRQALESRGYTFLGDFECLELEPETTERSHRDVFRYMLSSDQYTCGVYHQTGGHPWGAVRQCLAMINAGKGIRHSLTWLAHALPTEHVYDFESASGTRFLGTSNAMAAAAFDAPPEVDMSYMPSKDWEILHEAHERRLRSGIPAPLGKLVDFGTVWAMEEHVRRLKHAWRLSRGIYTLQELTRLTRGNVLLARELHTEIQAIVRGS